jgi:flavodoxin
MGRSEKDIAKLCPKATILKGFAIHGSRVNAAKKDVTDWLNKLV